MSQRVWQDHVARPAEPEAVGVGPERWEWVLPSTVRCFSGRKWPGGGPLERLIGTVCREGEDGVPGRKEKAPALQPRVTAAQQWVRTST